MSRKPLSKAEKRALSLRMKRMWAPGGALRNPKVREKRRAANRRAIDAKHALGLGAKDKLPNGHIPPVHAPQQKEVVVHEHKHRGAPRARKGTTPAQTSPTEAFAFGWTACWIDTYARSQRVSASAIAERVGGLLLGAARGSLLGA